MDTDESQDISVSEVLKMLHSQGFSSLGEDHVRQVVARFDQDSSGTIDLSEFRKLYEALLIDSSQRAISELPISSSNAIGDLTTALRKSGALRLKCQSPSPNPSQNYQLCNPQSVVMQKMCIGYITQHMQATFELLTCMPMR